MAIVYKITNKIDGKVYVGKTILNLEARWKKHCYNAQYGLNTYLYNAIRKYGTEVFLIELLEICDNSMVDEREKFYIDEYQTKILGYNMTEGGEGGDTSKSPSFKKWVDLISIEGHRAGANNINYGGRFGMKNKKHSITTIEKQSEVRQNYWNNLDSESLEKRSKQIRGENNPMFGKIPPNAIEVIFKGKRYNSISEAARMTNFSPYFIKKHGVTNG